MVVGNFIVYQDNGIKHVFKFKILVSPSLESDEDFTQYMAS